MTTEKQRPTTFDGIAAALSPALIIGMIGSLVFFLVIAFYRGQYDARLMYILGLYTAATVLVARIAIESDRARAAAFAVPLAIAAMLGMMRFVTISGDLAAFSWIVNIGLLALTWYLADRITFDCTLLEEDRESLQGGLLQTIGSSVAQASGQENKTAAIGTVKQPIGAAPLKKAKHNPGVWVLYFALVAFPLFGVGQLVIPDERQRMIAFWCLVVYLACALALLMTTSLLGMRRYLRQRGAMMPPEITTKWLIAGGVITCVVLLACMLMPLPGKQLSVAGIKIELTSPDNLQTSKFGWGSDQKPSDQEASQQKPSADKPSEDKSSEDKSSDQKSSDQKSSDQKSSDQKSSDHKPADQKPADQKSAGQKAEDQKSAGQKAEDQKQSDEKFADKKLPEQKQSDKKFADEKLPEQKQSDEKLSEEKQPMRAGDSLSQASRSLASSLLDSLKTLGGLFKWLLIAVLVGIVLLYVVTHFDEFKRLVNDFINFINALLGRRQTVATAQTESMSAAMEQPQRQPFSSFVNPFAKGLKGWQGPQVVQHTFAALEAWAAQRGRVRAVDQTADEFVRRLVQQEPELDRLPLQAAAMLDRVMFAGWQPTREEVAELSLLWDKMSR